MEWQTTVEPIAGPQPPRRSVLEDSRQPIRLDLCCLLVMSRPGSARQDVPLPGAMAVGATTVAPTADAPGRIADKDTRTGRIDWQQADLSGAGHSCYGPNGRPAAPYIYTLPRLERTSSFAAMRGCVHRTAAHRTGASAQGQRRGRAEYEPRRFGDLALFSLLLVSHEITLRGGQVSGEAERRCGRRPACGAWRRCGSRKFVGSGTDGRAFRAGGCWNVPASLVFRASTKLTTGKWLGQCEPQRHQSGQSPSTCERN